MLDSLVPISESRSTVCEAPSPELGELLAQIPAELPVPLLVTDLACSVVFFANAACEALWCRAHPDALGEIQSRMAALAADPARVDTLWRQRAENAATSAASDAYLLLIDGRQLNWRAQFLTDSKGVPAALLHYFNVELPAPAPLGYRLPGGDDLFRLTFDKAAVGMTLISSDLRFLRANPSLCAMLGYEEAELLVRYVPDLLAPGEWQGDELSGGISSGLETFHLERRFQHRSGHPVWVALSISVVRDAEGRPVFFVALAEDVTERKRTEAEIARRTQELQALASTDPLTGLYNHRYMLETLYRSLGDAARTGQPVSLLMIDIDRFRELNERYGHDAGNRALQGVAMALREALRDDDHACRYGGDELAVILEGASLQSALAVAERVRGRVESTRAVADGERTITCSIGVASYPAHASTVESLLKAADVALYQAKRSGKNRIFAFEMAANAAPAEHLELLQSGLQGASLEAVNALVTAVDLRDRFTGAHCQRVGRLSVELAVRLGCTEEEIEILRLGASLLDVGKIGLPDYLLTKTDALTRQEWDLMRQHPVWGENLVRRTALPREVLQLVRWHHERLDGSGYPDALKGDQIPLLVRVVNVADVATALREDRPHRRAWPRERVMEYLRRHAADKLDADVVRVYRELFGQKQ